MISNVWIYGLIEPAKAAYRYICNSDTSKFLFLVLITFCKGKFPNQNSNVKSKSDNRVLKALEFLNFFGRLVLYGTKMVLLYFNLEVFR